MIALNKLILNINKFKLACKFRGFDYDFLIDEIEELFQNEKKLSLDFEKSRSNCNKLCAELFKQKSNSNNENLSELYEQILNADSQANDFKRKAKNCLELINKKLSLLPNFPDEFLSQNTVLSKNSFCSKTSEDFFNFLSTTLGLKNSKETIKSFVKSLKNMIFEEEDLPFLTRCSDGFVLLDSETNLSLKLNEILEFCEEFAVQVKRIKAKNMMKASSDEYLVKFNDFSVKIEVVKEFFTREFSVKFKNKKLDMTEFLNQINFKIKR